jgi:hypothetical protein
MTKGYIKIPRGGQANISIQLTPAERPVVGSGQRSSGGPAGQHGSGPNRQMV